jgi:hypothetical protein
MLSMVLLEVLSIVNMELLISQSPKWVKKRGTAVVIQTNSCSNLGCGSTFRDNKSRVQIMEGRKSCASWEVLELVAKLGAIKGGRMGNFICLVI